MVNLIIDVEEMTCTRCNKTLPANEENFYKQKYSSKEMGIYYKLVHPCAKCRREISRERKRANREELNKQNYEYFLANKERIYFLRNKWMKENKEEMKEYQKHYRQSNKDKIKIYNEKHSNKKHTISKKEWELCKEYFNYECAYCGISEKDAKEQQGQNFHKEHFINDGVGDLSNCVPACRSCNSQKWEFGFEEWYTEDNPIYNIERKCKIYKWLNEDYKQYIQPKRSKKS